MQPRSAFNLKIIIKTIALSHRISKNLNEKDFQCCVCSQELFKLYNEFFQCSQKYKQSSDTRQKIVIDETIYKWPCFFLKRVVNEFVKNPGQNVSNVCDRYKNTKNKFCIIKKSLSIFIHKNRLLCINCIPHYAVDGQNPGKPINQQLSTLVRPSLR